MTAQGIEARSDETRSGSAEGESPVGAADAHNLSPEDRRTSPTSAPATFPMPTDRTDPVEVREAALRECLGTLSIIRDTTDDDLTRNAAAEALSIGEAALASTPEAQPDNAPTDVAAAQSVIDPNPEIVGDALCKIMSYNWAHQDAVEMGYPSLTEALEDLDRLRATPSASTDVAGLVERLRAKRQMLPAFGSGSTSGECVIHDDGFRLVNPDGPAAADALERLSSTTAPAMDKEAAQAEGFAAAVAQLRGLSAQKPTHPLADQANTLADSLERSRAPACNGDPCVCPTPCPVEPA